MEPKFKIYHKGKCVSTESDSMSVELYLTKSGFTKSEAHDIVLQATLKGGYKMSTIEIIKCHMSDEQKFTLHSTNGVSENLTLTQVIKILKSAGASDTTINTVKESCNRKEQRGIDFPINGHLWLVLKSDAATPKNKIDTNAAPDSKLLLL